MAMPERIKHYRVKRKIGSGGMATVYEALDTRNQARVALKVLHPHLADQPTYVARFQREAQMAMTLHSPHIVQMLEYGEDQGLHYLAMEYVSGVTLQQFVQQMGAVSVHQALSIIYQAALALDEANRHHIVHRDIKPHNIMILRNGMIKVMDFGIARDVTMDSMTTTGMFVGTALYSSPEQAGGERVDIRSDIYSLGVVLYQLLTGTAPFQADTPRALLLRVMQGNPVPVQSIRIDLPAPVAKIVEKMLAREPERRFQDPGELLAALAALTGSVPPEDARSEMATMVAPLVERTPPTHLPPARKSRLPAIIALSLVASVAMITALVIVFLRPWQPSSPENMTPVAPTPVDNKGDTIFEATPSPEPPPLTAPALIGPKDGSAFGDEVVMAWQAAPGASGYQVETRGADEQTWRSWPVEAGNEILRLVFADYPDYFSEEGRVYWWRVGAFGSDGELVFSRQRRWVYGAQIAPLAASPSPTAPAADTPVPVSPSATSVRAPAGRTQTVTLTVAVTRTAPGDASPTSPPVATATPDSPSPATATDTPLPPTPTEKPTAPPPVTEKPTAPPPATEKPTAPSPATATPLPTSSTSLTWQEPPLDGSTLALICGFGLIALATKQRRL